MTSETKSFRDRVSKEDEEIFAEYFGTRGYICTKLDKNNQQKPSDSPKTPDYLLEKEGLKIYCEIKSMFEQENFAKTEEISKRLVDRLQKLAYPFDFHLRVNTLNKLTGNKEKEIVNLCRNRLKQLENKLSLPIIIKTESRDIEIILAKWNNDVGFRCLSYPKGGGLIKSPQRLRNLIRKAASKFKNYAQDGNSYILIIFKHISFLDKQDFLTAIFGDRVVTFSIPSRELEESKPYYGPNKILTPNKNTIISAIALCEEIESSNNYIKRFVIFHNPYTKYPLDQKIFANSYNIQYIPKEIKPDGIEFDFVGSEV